MSSREIPAGLGVTWIQYILLVAGEAAWGYPWALAIGYWFGGGPPALDLAALVVLLVLSLVATRLAVAQRKRPRLAQAALSALGLLALCTVALREVPAAGYGGQWDEAWHQLLNTEHGWRAAVAAIFGGFLWRRGALLGRSLPSSYSVEDGFRTGVVALISLLMVSALAGGHAPAPGETLVVCTLLFVAFGLVGMPLAQIADVSRSSHRREGAALLPTTPWLGMLLAVVGGLLGATLLLSQLLTFERVGRAWDMVREPLGAFLGVVVQIGALPFALLVELLAFLLRLLVRPGSQPVPRKVNPAWPQGLPQQGELQTLSPELVLALKLLVAVALGMLFLWLLMRAISNLGRGWQHGDGEESRDFVWSWPGLGGLWRWLLARVRPVARLPRAAVRRGRRAGSASIRELYREFLALGASVGRARRSSETPLEYQRRLEADRALIGREEVQRLTESYVQVRYGLPREKEPDIGAVALALERLKALWHR